MDDLAFLRSRIESYADYTNDDDRRLADEQIRAYVGEALARVRERLQPASAAAETLDRLVLRCQFADQRVIRSLDETTPAAAEITQLHGLDRELVTLADREPAAGLEALVAYLGEVESLLDRRNRLILGTPAR